MDYLWVKTVKIGALTAFMPVAGQRCRTHFVFTLAYLFSKIFLSIV
jgi:hypothetical protein